jgi:hypothetical protein
MCHWLANEQMGDEWHPMRCKMLLSRSQGGEDLIVTVDPAFPNAWRREPYYSRLRTLAQQGSVKVRIGLRIIGVSANGTEETVYRSQEWIEGR